MLGASRQTIGASEFWPTKEAEEDTKTRNLVSDRSPKPSESSYRVISCLFAAFSWQKNRGLNQLTVAVAGEIKFPPGDLSEISQALEVRRAHAGRPC